MRLLAIITVPALYILFALTSVLAGAWGLLALPFSPRTTGRIMRSMDCLLAAMLGWDGRETVSTECGQCDKCKLCVPLCKVLDKVLEKNHCQKRGST